MGSTEPPVCLHASVIQTKKSGKKQMRGLRVSADDARRVREFWKGLSAIADEYCPTVLAFEVYAPYRSQGGSAWKTGRIEGAIQMFGFDRGYAVLPFLPLDLKKGICGVQNASKDDVLHAVSERVVGLDKFLQRIHLKLQEHAADAAGHAYLAFEEMSQMRTLMGM